MRIKVSKALAEKITEYSESHTFSQKSFPMYLTFDGVLIAEANSEWKHSIKSSNKNTSYRTSFLLYRDANNFYLVKRGESTDPDDSPYEDVYTFNDFHTLRSWILSTDVKVLKMSKPIRELILEVPKNTEFMSEDEIKYWIECFIEGSNG